MGETEQDAKRVEGQLADLLQGSLGLNIYPRLRAPGPEKWRPALTAEPFLAGLLMFAAYAFFFAVLPWLFHRLSGGVPASLWPLLTLQLYGALWSGWAVTSTRIASRSVADIIRRQIIPALSPDALAYVAGELDRRYTRPRARRALYLWSWGLGMAAAATAGLILKWDLPTTLEPSWGDILWWCLGWTLLYTTAAKVVNVSRFYEIFSAAVAHDRQALFWLNPAASSVVASMTLAARRVLLFWMAIAISIALILPFGSYIAGLLGVGLSNPLAALSGGSFVSGLHGFWFMAAHLLGTAFFSIGIGSIIFLRSEGHLRRAVNSASAEALRKIEKQLGALQDVRLASEGDLQYLADLRKLHAEVADRGAYWNVLFSGLSVIIPFVPITPLLQKWLGI